MTHTPQHHPAGTPGDSPMIDLVPGEPPVPITVWRTPAGDDQAPVTTRLARRLLSGYSEPGDTIVDLTDTDTVAAVAAAGDRTHVRAVFTDSRTIVVTATTPPPANRRLAKVWRALVGGGEPPEITDWFGDDLRDPDRPAGTTSDTPPPRPSRGTRAASLLIAVWPLHDHEPANSDRLAAVMVAAVTVLRPGGCVAFIAATQQTGEYSTLVGAARAAGLRYLQHIVAVRADVTAEQFVYYATDADLAALDAGIGHTPVHTDIVVFVSPGGGTRG